MINYMLYKRLIETITSTKQTFYIDIKKYLLSLYTFIDMYYKNTNILHRLYE